MNNTIIAILWLILTPFLGGGAVFWIRDLRSHTFQRVLMFGGGYLFSITILHLLPEVFLSHASTKWVGVYILLGFFFQLLLELFTRGIEHGHRHDIEVPVDQDCLKKEEVQCKTGRNCDQIPKEPAVTGQRISPYTLLIALCIHAVFDGVVLCDPTHGHHSGYVAHNLLLGILLHKAPVAFALVSMLRKYLPNKKHVLLCLAVFAIASPIGLCTSQYAYQSNWISQYGVEMLMAVVSGNFLHISTTIFFESSPSHHVNLQKLLVSLSGAFLAVVLEVLL